MDYFETSSLFEKELCIRATEQLIPIYGILELSPLCNMNCSMCFVRLSPEELQRQGRLRTAKEWLSIGKEMQKAGTLFILLTGGEPLLYPEFRDVYLGLRKMGMILTINTNGTMIDEEWADFFAKYRPRRINITLYGASSETYGTLCRNPDGFEKTLSAIRLLKARGIDVKINGSLVPQNQHEGLEIIRIAEALGAAYKIDTYMYPASRERSFPFSQQSRLSPSKAAKVRVQIMKAEQSWEKFKEVGTAMLSTAANTPTGPLTGSHIPCRAGRSSFTINWQGNMRPCVMLTAPNASVFDIGFDAAWKQIISDTAQITLSPKCSACTLRKVCTTCAACAKSECGSFDSVPEYMCRYTSEILRLLAEELHTGHPHQEDHKIHEESI